VVLTLRQSLSRVPGPLLAAQAIEHQVRADPVQQGRRIVDGADRVHAADAKEQILDEVLGLGAGAQARGEEAHQIGALFLVQAQQHGLVRVDTLKRSPTSANRRPHTAQHYPSFWRKDDRLLRAASRSLGEVCRVWDARRRLNRRAGSFF
jgi:hypothetical protein